MDSGYLDRLVADNRARLEESVRAGEVEVLRGVKLRTLDDVLGEDGVMFGRDDI